MGELIPMSRAATILQISSSAVRVLIRRGFIAEAGRTDGAIQLHRTDVERLAREGWPGRREKLPRGI